MPSSSDTYLHGHHDSVLRSHRWRTAENSAGYLLPRLAPDARVLDVGCGPGTITADLAALVPGGYVTGIDAAGDVLAQARQEAERRGQRNVTFDTGDVYRLDFADGTFDVVHAHQVLQHLTDPVAALREMRRVCRPGGLVAAVTLVPGLAARWLPPRVRLVPPADPVTRRVFTVSRRGGDRKPAVRVVLDALSAAAGPAAATPERESRRAG